jgi:hypothetical protein
VIEEHDVTVSRNQFSSPSFFLEIPENRSFSADLLIRQYDDRDVQFRVGVGEVDVYDNRYYYEFSQYEKRIFYDLAPRLYLKKEEYNFGLMWRGWG